MKTQSTFFGSGVRATIQRNIKDCPHARAERDRVVAEAAHWAGMSEDELWGMMFGPTIGRSWMVWSNGHCPACKKPVVMYGWKIDPVKRPWKAQCPSCDEVFPKNDFAAYYKSGLTRDGVFDFALADRDLLFNEEHPEEGDPLRGFGVDDGKGYVEGGNTWRFIGAYLIYGQWKRMVLAAVRTLAAAYVVTGDLMYSRKAGVMLDRIADVFPGFDYKVQGLTYEKSLATGYVTVWHDAVREQMDLVIAYDQVYDALAGDGQLIAFLAGKAEKLGLENAKKTGTDVHRNIQERLIKDPLSHVEKVRSNFPATPGLLATTHAVLGWEDASEREAIYQLCEDVVRRATRVDGVTGEKGLMSYAQYTLTHLANAVALFLLADADFVARLMAKVPSFQKTYRFHIDTWCGDQKAYPCEGDAAWYGAGKTHYCGVGTITKEPGAGVSMDRFLWEIYRATGDLDYLRILEKEAGPAGQGPVFDLTLDGCSKVAGHVKELVAKHGAQLRLKSIDMKDWHIAILRSGEPGHERAVWMDYDSGGGHGHQDAMNLGLIAHGMELLPDAGYPAVQFGGWDTEKGLWFNRTQAHNTVTVDGKTQRYHAWAKPNPGYTRLWTQNPTVKMMDARASGAYGINKYDRTVVLVDMGENDFYVVDLFEVEGGKDHAKFVQSTFGEMKVSGLRQDAGGNPGYSELLRNFMGQKDAPAGWSADWKVNDVFEQLPKGLDLHLKYTDLSVGAEACRHEGWFVQGQGMDQVKEVWLPRLMIRRQGGGEGVTLRSMFVSVMEPYVGESKIASIRRVDSGTKEGVAIELVLKDGRRDVIHLKTYGEAHEGVAVGGEGGALVRYGVDGRVTVVSLMHGVVVETPEVFVAGDGLSAGVELAFEYGVGGEVSVEANAENLCDVVSVQEVRVGGKRVEVKGKAFAE